MAVDMTAFMPSLITAAAGLGGVALGGFLTWQREASRQKDRDKKEASYLAILVVAHLDRFVDGCLRVSYDDGTIEGEPAGSGGMSHPTEKAPTFDALALTVDWKVLPADLMYGILNLPYKTEQLVNSIIWDDPPDYGDAFWTRQEGFAVLGLAVSELALTLRKHAGLPVEKLVAGKWNREDALRQQRDKVTKERADYEARMAARGPWLPPGMADC